MTDSLLAHGREVLAAITDDAIREACRTTYFPTGLKLSQLEDTQFFQKHNLESDFDDGSQTDTDGSVDSDDSSGVDDCDSDNDGECDVVWAKSGHGVWGLCHVLEDTLYLTSAVPSNLSVPKVSDSDRAATSAHAKKSPKPGEYIQLFRMKRDRNKGFYSEKCLVEVSIALCFEWAGCLVPRDALPSVHNIVARPEHCVQRTLPVRTVFLGHNYSLDMGGRGNAV